MKKTITIITAMLLISLNTFSQAPNWTWAKDAYTGYSQANSVVTDASGNVYVAGAFYFPIIVFGNDTLVNANAVNYPGDILLVKYDAAGNYLWSRSAGGKAADIANAVTTDAFGNVYVTGYYFSDTLHFGSVILTNPDSISNIFLAKYNSNGNILWARSVTGNLSQTSNAIVTDAIGNVYIAGKFFSDTITFGATTLINKDTSTDIYVQTTDIFIAKYDSSGNVLWAQRAGGNKIETVTSLLADDVGHIYMDGTFQSDTISFGSAHLINNDTSGTTSDIFITKYDTSGTIIWTKKAGSLGNDIAGTMTLDNASNIFLSGNTDFAASINLGSVVISNYTGRFLAKYDSAGITLWAINTGQTDGSPQDGNFVSTDAFGNVYLAGNFRNNTITFDTITLTNTNNNATNDIFLVKYDSSGHIHWAKQVAGVYDDIAMDLICDASGDVYMTGYFGSPTAIFNQTALSNPGMYLAKIDNTTGINTVNLINNGVLVYPNPASSEITIRQLVIPTKEESLFIINILGQEVYSQTLNNSQTTINISKWSNGVYFYEIGSGLQISTSIRGKFVVEK